MLLWRSAPPHSTMSLEPGDQLLDRHVDGGERRRARRVDGVVDAAEVEPVRDPPGDHVRQHAGERVLGQRRQRGVEPVGQRPRRTAGTARGSEYALDRSVPASAPKITAVRSRSNAPLAVARVGERAARDLERRAAAPARSPRATSAGCRRRADRTGCRRGSRPTWTASSCRRWRRSRPDRSRSPRSSAPAAPRGSRSSPATMLRQNASGSGAPGKIAAMPIDRDVGGVAPPSALVEPRRRRREHLGGPRATSRCSSAIEHVPRRSAATCPIMYMPSRCCSASSTATSCSPSRRSPFAAMRSRPRFSCSSAAHISFAGTRAASSRALLARERADVRGVGAARRVARRRLEQHRALARAAPPPGTAARSRPPRPPRAVNRYAVPISTPSFAPRAASGAAIAATIAAERASWMPPAKSTLSVVARRRARAAARSAPPTARSSCAARRGRRTRGPRTRSAARRRLQEQIEQPRRRHVQVGRDALRLERRAPATAGRRR